jgi:hypothetical protein
VSVQQNLSAVAGNDLKWHVSITFGAGPLDLTLYTPLAVLKPSATSPDSAGTTYGIGSGLTYTYETSGRFDWVIPHSAAVPSGAMWYRIDIDDGSTLVTAMYGTLTLIAA